MLKATVQTALSIKADPIKPSASFFLITLY